MRRSSRGLLLAQRPHFRGSRRHACTLRQGVVGTRRRGSSPQRRRATACSKGRNDSAASITASPSPPGQSQLRPATRTSSSRYRPSIEILGGTPTLPAQVLRVGGGLRKRSRCCASSSQTAAARGRSPPGGSQRSWYEVSSKAVTVIVRSVDEPCLQPPATAARAAHPTSPAARRERRIPIV